MSYLPVCTQDATKLDPSLSTRATAAILPIQVRFSLLQQNISTLLIKKSYFISLFHIIYSFLVKMFQLSFRVSLICCEYIRSCCLPNLQNLLFLIDACISLQSDVHEKGWFSNTSFKTRLKTLPTFRPDALAFFRAKIS